MADRKLIVQIVGDSRSVEKAFKRVGAAGSNFERRMAKLGKAIGIGIGGAFLAMGFAMKRGFAEAMEAERVLAQTQAVLKSTGGAANVTAKHVSKLATSLSLMAGIDDEAIAAGENMLLTFTNIRNAVGKGPKVFDMATQAILDMSVATGKDMVTTAIMVGKALNDVNVNARGTITGWSALRRVGVMISPMMMKQAAAFIAAGKPMEAQLLLLKELNTEFGGSARALGTTMTGSLGRLRNAFDELMAAFAEGFLPLILRVNTALTKRLANPAFVARVRELGQLIGVKLRDAFIGISKWFAANWPSIRQGFANVSSVLQRVHLWLTRIASILPGGGATLIGAILTGMLAMRLAGARRQAGGLNAGLLAMTAHPWVLAISLVLLNKDAINEWVKKNIPGAGVTKFDLTKPGEIEKLPAFARPKATAMARGGGPVYGGPHAKGGPVKAGVTYPVGERGREWFTAPADGTIIPNGAGGVHIGTVHLHGVQNARQLLNELERLAKGHGGQTRGRFGGQKLALG